MLSAETPRLILPVFGLGAEASSEQKDAEAEEWGLFGVLGIAILVGAVALIGSGD